MKNTEVKKISKRIKIARFLSNLTLKQLSSKTSISVPTLSRIENGLRVVNTIELMKIASATNKSIPFFYEDEEIKEDSTMYKILEHFDPTNYD